MRQPLGIGAGITPFNFPAMIPMWMFGMAIACGNAFILKPSERDPTVPVRLAELMKEAGLPDGILNVVHGDKEMVDAILDHPDIAAVSFVGSSDIAQYIYSRGTAHNKRVQAFGGAKNHGIVMPDADLDQVVNDLAGAAFGSAGERCMALPVVVPVGDKTADALREKLIPAIEGLRVGVSTDPEAHYGPVVSKAHKERIESYIQLAIDEGSELVVDGRRFALQGHEEGFFIGPTFFDHVKPSMKSYQDEIFGPVLQMVRAQDFEEAVRLPSEHAYGNGVAIFTRNGHAAREFTARVNVGMVGINVPIPVPVSYHSFGAWTEEYRGPGNFCGGGYRVALTRGEGGLGLPQDTGGQAVRLVLSRGEVNIHSGVRPEPGPVVMHYRGGTAVTQQNGGGVSYTVADQTSFALGVTSEAFRGIKRDGGFFAKANFAEDSGRAGSCLSA